MLRRESITKLTCKFCGRPEDCHERGEIEAEYEGRKVV